MNNGMVSLRDYEGIQGFGMSSAAEVEDLNKALSAGVQRPPTSGGNVLRVESLEATLRITTLTLQHVKLWKKLNKLPAFNTVEEYNLLTDYGADAGAFTNEGDLPETQDSTYQRKVAYVKFMGTTREVTHPMTLVRPAHGSVIGLETQNGATWLVERIERALFEGDSAMVPQSFDGFPTQILEGVGVVDPNEDLYPGVDTLGDARNTVIIDKRGQSLSEDDLEIGANYVLQNYGTPTDLFMAPAALSDLARKFYPRERVNLPAPVDGKVGFTVKSFDTSAGLVEFNNEIFLRSGRNNGVKTAPGSATNAKAPAAPTLTSATAAANTGGTSKFGAADAGAYYYKVTAVNRYGESAASAAVSASPAAGQKVTLVITPAAGDQTAFKVYRSAKGAADGSQAQYMTMVASAGANPTTTSVVDRNWYIPGCSIAPLFQMNLQNMSWRQLAPMLKIPLATIAASIRWMQLIYGTPILYTPKKNVLFINVADS